MAATTPTPTVSPTARHRVRDLLRPHLGTLTLAFLAVIGETATDVLEPWPIKIVIDNVVQGKALPHWLMHTAGAFFTNDRYTVLNIALTVVIAIAILGAISTYAEKYLTTNVSQWVAHDLRLTLYHHIQRLSLADHDEARTGDLITRVTDDIGSVQDFINSALLGIIVSVLTIVGMIGVMLWVNWRFTLIALSVAPVMFGVVYTSTRRIKQAARAVRKKESAMLSDVSETLNSIRVVQAFAREDFEEQRLETDSLDSVKATLTARSMKARLPPMVDIIIAIGTCMVLGYGARLVIDGRITPGVLVVFVLYLGKMYKPMKDLSKMTDTVSKAMVGYERISEVLDVESSVRDQTGARPAPKLAGKIAFDHVTFTYNDATTVLQDLSFCVEPGQVAAFVGASGAGKTTIASLIPRFYDPTSGTIMIDGKDIRRYTLKSLRDQISFVLQDTVLFRGTVYDNIAYGKPTATRQEIARAAKLANAQEFIDKLPQRYDTMLGERGATLSGGQRQRIAIARAIVRDTPILILDEPTSSLDTSSEQAVVEALDRLMKNKTAIVIAHHLGTIKHADIIFVLQDARLVEQGTHEALMAKGGVYTALNQAAPASAERTGTDVS